MNLTVGPLPPAVYWRRRAIVLAGLLAVVLLLVYACGTNTSDASGQRSTGLSSTPTGLPPSHQPTASDQPSTMPSVSPSGSGAPSSPGTPAASSAGGVPACTDKDIKVFPVISSTSPSTSKLQFGGTFDIKLEIKNTSGKACTRDVGSIAEELYIKRGTTKIWSSDDCNPPPGKPHDVRTFQPGVLIFADVKWSSYNITTHNCRRAASAAQPAKYQLFARVGSKLSDPVTFEIVN
jgi:hypothetical protein